MSGTVATYMHIIALTCNTLPAAAEQAKLVPAGKCIVEGAHSGLIEPILLSV